MNTSTPERRSVTGRHDRTGTAVTQKVQHQTLLLRAMLGAGPSGARKAWDQWLGAVGDPVAHLRADMNGLRRLLPLLLAAVRRNGLSVDRTFLTVLRSAHVREELRYRIYRRILAQVLAAMHAGKIEAILVNGAALAHSIYPEPMLRHCHNIDLYCNAAHMARMAELLRTLGFRETARNGGCIGFEHGSGLPLELHQRLLGADDATRQFAAVYEISQSFEIDGNPVRILSPEDSLLQICAHGPGEGGIPAPWLVCDAWMQLKRGAHLDPDLLREGAAGIGRLEALGYMQEYLASELGAPLARCLPGPLAGGPQTSPEHGVFRPDAE